jgi:hypothetical protein
VESVPAPHARQTLSGWRLRQGSGQGR